MIGLGLLSSDRAYCHQAGSADGSRRDWNADRLTSGESDRIVPEVTIEEMDRDGAPLAAQ